MAAIISHGPAARLPRTSWAPTTRTPTAPTRRRTGAVQPESPSIDVYRRRRAVAAIVAAGVVWCAGHGLSALGGGSLTTSGVDSAPAPQVDAGPGSVLPISTVTHVVAPGDTLWSIARGFQPRGDVRPLVDAMAASRNGRPLQVGEIIHLP